MDSTNAIGKSYFHPRIDEHFGISTVEAMASGLVLVVSDIGGHIEFVPSKYHFHTLSHAADVIALAFEATNSERAAISSSTTNFLMPIISSSFIIYYRNYSILILLIQRDILISNTFMCIEVISRKIITNIS
ncbi:MAG: glycosyltransferase [Pyrinomonadaceae bacterium]|nr:glycosyltransferase [Pyrinomonadaceae bacterium]